jgi:hypothetical protein
MIEISKTVPGWLFDYVWMPIVRVMIWLGIKTTITYSDGTKKIFNET